MCDQHFQELQITQQELEQTYGSILDAADADTVAAFDKAMEDEGFIERRDDDNDGEDDDEEIDDPVSDNKFAAFGLEEKSKGRFHNLTEGKLVGVIHDIGHGKSYKVGS